MKPFYRADSVRRTRSRPYHYFNPQGKVQKRFHDERPVKSDVSAAPRSVMVKLLHTSVWAFIAGCILALPAAAWLRRFDWALILTGIILIECAVMALNRGRCPLTDVAARYTA